ncbi:hypothetical protein [Sphingobacterium sp. xlx-130]|uniref:hypothetical protein n=1 Tax=Sphingobacterium sp. xlx-130 TaxID=2654323 RepID=UPI0013DD38A5|nr:hypothetical protein [Sphingobacterium sp. xlx-130]
MKQVVQRTLSTVVLIGVLLLGLRAQTVDLRESEIVLDLYTSITMLETIIERGKYQLLIKHNKDIVQFAVWKNGRPIKHMEWKDNKAYALYKGIRSSVNKPMLRFGRSTMYRIQIQLEGEAYPRVFCIRTRHPDTPKPTKEELGFPI